MTLRTTQTRQLTGGLHYNRVEAPFEKISAPAFLPEDVRDEFVLIIQDLEQLKPGLSTRADRIMLIGFARAMALFNKLAEELMTRPLHTRSLHGEMKLSPYFAAYDRVNSSIMKYCQYFGLSPLARARIPAPPTRPGAVNEAEAEIDDLFR